MARFRSRGMALRPVKSLKHVVDTNGGITGGTPSTTDVLNVTENPPTTTANAVETGSHVYSVFLNVQVIQKVAAGGVDNIYMIVFWNPSNNLVAPPVDGVGADDNRRFVLHQEMRMTGTVLTAADAIPLTLFKGVVRIPKVFHRNGIQDKLQVLIGHRSAEVTQQSNFCLQAIYKEFR